MNLEEIKTMIKKLDDPTLIEYFQIAKSDCESASVNDPNSDWHEQCFSAVLVLSQEMIERKLSLSTLY